MTSNAFVGKCKKREKMYHNSLVWNSQLPKRHISPITTSSSPSWKSLWPRKKNGGGGRSTSSEERERGNGELISIIRAFGLPGYCMYSWLCSMSLYVNREGGGTTIPFWKKGILTIPTYNLHTKMFYYKLLFINKSCLQSAQKVFCSGYLKTAGYT